MISKEEAAVMANSRASKAYDSVHSNDFSDQTNTINNLKSSLSNIISRVATSSEGEYTEDMVNLAKEYQGKINEVGGIQNLNLSRVEVNSLMSEADAVYSHNPELLQAEHDTMAQAAQPLVDGLNDEQVAEIEAVADAEARNSEKPYSEEDNVIISETTGSKFVRQEDGSLTPYVDKGSDEYMAEVAAEADAAFMASAGAQEGGMFSGLKDV